MVRMRARLVKALPCILYINKVATTYMINSMSMFLYLANQYYINSFVHSLRLLYLIIVLLLNVYTKK